MIKPFICGSGTFHHQLEEDDDQELHGSPCSTPRNKPRKKDKNPYANRGRDKFSALLAELEDKRQQIYTQMGSDEISFVRFQYSNLDEIKPIVVKVRDHKQQKEKNNDHPTTKHHDDKEKVDQSQTNEVLKKSRNELGDDQKTEKKKEKSYLWNNFPQIMDMWKPSYYLPAAMILILLFLAMFGRSFAIICTSIGWYLVPTIKGSGSTSNQVKIKPRKKKEYSRRASERKIVYGGNLSSPTSVITGAANDFSPRQRGHRKSF